jgi:hypothetical protein
MFVGILVQRFYTNTAGLLEEWLSLESEYSYISGIRVNWTFIHVFQMRCSARAASFSAKQLSSFS